jgi:hypothetical protein
LVGRAILAALLAANDYGYPGAFDEEARDVLMGRRHIGEFSQNIFYWLCRTTSICVARDIAITEYFLKDGFVASLIKFRPLAFLVAKRADFHQHYRLNDFFKLSDENIVHLPISRRSVDRSPAWPAVPTKTGAVLMGQTTTLLASPGWRDSTIVRV